MTNKSCKPHRKPKKHTRSKNRTSKHHHHPNKHAESLIARGALCTKNQDDINLNATVNTLPRNEQNRLDLQNVLNQNADSIASLEREILQHRQDIIELRQQRQTQTTKKMINLRKNTISNKQNIIRNLKTTRTQITQALRAINQQIMEERRTALEEALALPDSPTDSDLDGIIFDGRRSTDSELEAELNAMIGEEGQGVRRKSKKRKNKKKNVRSVTTKRSKKKSKHKKRTRMRGERDIMAMDLDTVALKEGLESGRLKLIML